MITFIRKHRHLCHAFIFSLLVVAMLLILSQVCLKLNRRDRYLYNYDSLAIYNEPEHSLDVVSIGSSDIYSSLNPLTMYKDKGFTSYSYGQGAERICETYLYLKKIFKSQSPKVVVIDVGSVFRETSLVTNLDVDVKAHIAQVFPVVMYHSNLIHIKSFTLSDFTQKSVSITKGYFLRNGQKKVKNPTDYMSDDGSTIKLHPYTQRMLRKSIDLCIKNGATPIFLVTPSYTGWNYAKHKTVQAYADQEGIPLLDLNVLLQEQIDWTKDTGDKGNHVNYYGAEKVSHYLADYLTTNFDLPDHRNDAAYQTWDEYYKAFEKEVKRLNL